MLQDRYLHWDGDLPSPEAASSVGTGDLDLHAEADGFPHSVVIDSGLATDEDRLVV